MVGFGAELDRLNIVWQQVVKEAIGIDVDAALRKLNEQQQS
jgi:hypothetical protein